MALTKPENVLRTRRHTRELALVSQAEAPSRSLGGNGLTFAPPDVFTPTQPIRGGGGLVGRQRESARIIEALVEEQAHVVLYSERGRGKTSLVNSLVRTLRARGHIVARHTCEAGSTYDGIMRGLVRDLPRSLLAVPAQRSQAVGERDEGCDAALPPGNLRPRDIVALPTRLTTPELVCVIDEFDRIEDAETRTRLADTIKQLSDRGMPMSFMIVGVSSSLDQILGQHPSIQRALVAVHLPLLSGEDVAALVSGGLRQAAVTVEAPLLQCLVTLSLGMPYVAQLLGLRLLQAVRRRGDTVATWSDMRVALQRVVDEANPRIPALLARLTDHGRNTAMVAALRRVALAQQDPYGRIEADVQNNGVYLGEQVVPTDCWEKLRLAGVIDAWNGEAEGRDTRWYGFGERQLIHHVLLMDVLKNVNLKSFPAAASS